jgi:hypothetical protein
MAADAGNGLPLLNTCVFCEDNNTRVCIKCHRYYCILHSSRISPQLCQDCFKQVSVTIEKYTRTNEDYDATTDSIVEHKTSCKQIRMDGPDYVWYSVAIQQSTDEELGGVLEFHKFMVSLIESLKTTREVVKNKLLREEGDKNPLLTKETTTRTKTKTKIKQQKSPRDILLASGIKEDNPLFATLLAQMEKGATS